MSVGCARRMKQGKLTRALLTLSNGRRLTDRSSFSSDHLLLDVSEEGNDSRVVSANDKAELRSIHRRVRDRKVGGVGDASQARSSLNPRKERRTHLPVHG